MKKRKVYICFDYDNDSDIKGSLVSQAKLNDSPFDITDMSIKETISSKWKDEARKRIKGCDVVIVLCGKYTDTAPGVSAELTITQEENKPYFLLEGHGNKSVPPKGALKTDVMHKWQWDNLKRLINGGR